MLTVEDLMTPGVMTLTPQDTVGRADADMKAASIRHVPVTDGKRHVVGMISNRDVMRVLGRSGRAKDVSIAEAMSHPVWTVSPKSPAYEAAAQLLEHKIGALPVVDQAGELVGIVTESDFLKIAYQALRYPATVGSSQPGPV